MGNDGRTSVLPVKEASGPGFLGPSYNPADEMLPPAEIGVSRGDSLDHVLNSVKGVIYYGDMIAFGSPSSDFTKNKPGLKPLGVNYFVNSGLTCSNGATMWEYVKTIPNGDALGQKVKDALAGVGLPPLKGMAPGMLEDVKFALNPMPIINAVVGSGYPQCRLVKKMVGNTDGKIENVDGVLLVDPSGLLLGSDGRYYQEHWIQDRSPVKKSNNEEEDDNYLRGDPIQLSYDDWSAAPKTYKESGCRVDPAGSEVQPKYCSNKKPTKLTLGDGTTVLTYSDSFHDYSNEMKRLAFRKPNHNRIVSLSVAVISIMCLMAFWNGKKK